MKLPRELINLLELEPNSGEEIISRSRAVVFHAPHLDDEIFAPFVSIDSQTDHIELHSTWPFPLPSTRINLNDDFDVKDVENVLAGACSSSVSEIIRPNSKKYRKELDEIFDFFRREYNEARRAILTEFEA